MSHEPVLTREVLEMLAPGRGGLFVDCTVGGGGHSLALLEGGATRLVGLDRDPSALVVAAETLRAFRDRTELVHADFREIDSVLDARGIGTIQGALADLGVSSMQLDAPGRGFSFQRDEPLDMRMDTTRPRTAADLIRQASESDLAGVIGEYGEERHARRVARAIVRARERAPIDTTGQLADLVRRAIPRRGWSRIDPATRTFQAIRIWVNQELEGLERFLVGLLHRLATGGRAAVIAFHSLEDRIVKHTFRSLERGGDVSARVLTKKPIVPTEDEIARNPRARSAKLRAIERVA
ncbi:MAG TPA: 16S rRNA (cytosine(1402)-N(4))-methyltransferase RsmH [Vicinamibacterales bacterium]